MGSCGFVFPWKSKPSDCEDVAGSELEHTGSSGGEGQRINDGKKDPGSSCLELETASLYASEGSEGDLESLPGVWNCFR